jgi:hypothetical protein
MIFIFYIPIKNWVQYIFTCNMDKHEKKQFIDLKTFQGKGLRILFGQF